MGKDRRRKKTTKEQAIEAEKANEKYTSSTTVRAVPRRFIQRIMRQKRRLRVVFISAASVSATRT